MNKLILTEVSESQGDYKIVRELPKELLPDTIYFVEPHNGKPGQAYLSSKDGKTFIPLPTQFIEESKPPLLGHWSCDQNTIFCNSVPIVTGNISVGFDLFKQKEVLDWICEVLNMRTNVFRFKQDQNSIFGTFNINQE